MSTQEFGMDVKYQLKLGASELLSTIAEKADTPSISSRIEGNSFWIWKSNTREWALTLHGKVNMISEDHCEIAIKSKLKGDTIVILSVVYSLTGIGIMAVLREYFSPLIFGGLWLSIFILSLLFHKRFTRTEHNELMRFIQSIISPFKIKET